MSLPQIQHQPLPYLLDNCYDMVVKQDIDEKTRAKYLIDMDSFLSFVDDNGFDPDTILKYKEYLKSVQNIKAGTKAAKLRIAKYLCTRLFHKGITNELYGEGVKNFRVTREHKRPGLTREEVNSVFNYIESLPLEMKYEAYRGQNKHVRTMKTNKYRDHVITCLLAYQGLRTFEVCALQADTVDFTNKVLFIKGKNRDDREQINLHPKTVESLRTYMSYHHIKSGDLISSRQKKQFPESSLRGIYKDTRTGIFKLLEIPKVVHGFRHFYITTLLEKMKDPMIVMKFARLRSMETIKIYDDRLKMDGYLPDFHDAF